MTLDNLTRPRLTASPSPMATPIPGRSSVDLNHASFSSSSSVSGSVSSSYRSASNADSIRTSFIPLSRASSASSTFSFASGEVEVVREEGVRHAEAKLQAKRYKTLQFAQDLLDILFALRVPTWFTTSDGYLDAEKIKIFKVAGSLTNAVFFISYPSTPSIKTVLLRIYGPASSSLISRPRELHVLHVLSSQYHIGPRVYGTFLNGRIEEYFESDALTSIDLRDSTISRWIAARMAELHCVDIRAVEEDSSNDGEERSIWDVAARDNVRSWLKPALEVLSLQSAPKDFKQAIEIDLFIKEWERYMSWLVSWENNHGHSKRVFAHNDAQYGNLLRLQKVKDGVPDHRQIIVVDFEYAAPNAAAFDIANHFQEWTANYHSPTPHILDPSRYPTEKDRMNFYHAYVSNACPPFTTVAVGSTARPAGDLECSQPSTCKPEIEKEVQQLEAQVRAWSPATHAMWAVWGIVQARDDLEQAAKAHDEGGRPEEPEFDYLGYSQCRFECFRREIRALGL